MTDAVPKLWWMYPALATQTRVDALQVAREPKAEVVNLSAVYDFLLGPSGWRSAGTTPGVDVPVAGADLSAMPTPKLRIAPKTFTYDHFVLGLPMTSRRLRDALALAPEHAQHLDVDCADCPQKAQAMDYKALNVLAFANPLDRERTGPGRFVDVDTASGPTFVWIGDEPGPNAPTPRIAWAPGFVPPAPLFRVPGTSWTLATEELADRVTRAGFLDVMFLDVTNDGTRMGMPPMRPAGGASA